MIVLFYEESYTEKKYILRIGNLSQIIKQLIEINQWNSLIITQRMNGTEKDQKEIEKLVNLLNFCNEKGCLEKFKIKTTSIMLNCIMCAENSKELNKMKKYVLSKSNIEKKFHKMLNLMFENLDNYIIHGESDQTIYDEFSKRENLDSGFHYQFLTQGIPGF